MINKLYEESEYSHIIHKLDDTYIPFDTSWKNVGIAVSGGADSALLAYMICKLIHDSHANTTVHFITTVRMWKSRPWQKFNSLDVYNYISTCFPSIKTTRHESFIAPDLEWGSKGPNIIDDYGQLVSGDIVQLRSYAEYVSYTNSLDAYYNAVTKNPNVDLAGKLDKRDVEPSPETFHLAIKPHMNTLACHPFRFVNKSWIYKQYVTLDILDLFDLTRSCEGDFDNLDYTNYIMNQSVPTCGKCFWCLEREWAINSYNV